jgi:hypothetical protein
MVPSGSRRRIVKSEITALGNEMIKRQNIDSFYDIVLGPFAQETQDWTDPVTNEFFAASFDYFSTLRGVRKSDGTNFAVQVRLNHRIVDGADDKKRVAYIENALENTIFQLSTYSNCNCFVGYHCERHSHG